MICQLLLISLIQFSVYTSGFAYYSSSQSLNPYTTYLKEVNLLKEKENLLKKEKVEEKKKMKKKEVSGCNKEDVKDYISSLTLDRKSCTWDSNVAIALFTSESGLNCNAVSSTHDYGVTQINSLYQRNRINGRDLKDYKKNIDIACEIYKEQGFSPWTNFRNGRYKKYLK